MKVASDTSPRLPVRFAAGLIALSSATASDSVRDRWSDSPCKPSWLTAALTTSSVPESLESSTDDVSPEKQLLSACEKLEKQLALAGYFPAQKGRTADGSVLFQFGTAAKTWVDIYPNGDLIVLRNRGATEEVHELSWDNTDRVQALLADGGVAI